MDKTKSCKDCPDRHFLCWDDCAPFARRKEAREKYKAKERHESAVTGYIKVQIHKSRPNYNDLRGQRGGYDCDNLHR